MKRRTRSDVLQAAADFLAEHDPFNHRVQAVETARERGAAPELVAQADELHRAIREGLMAQRLDPVSVLLGVQLGTVVTLIGADPMVQFAEGRLEQVDSWSQAGVAARRKSNASVEARNRAWRQRDVELRSAFPALSQRDRARRIARESGAREGTVRRVLQNWLTTLIREPE